MRVKDAKEMRRSRMEKCPVREEVHRALDPD
jgi:hypothetical protein